MTIHVFGSKMSVCSKDLTYSYLEQLACCRYLLRVGTLSSPCLLNKCSKSWSYCEVGELEKKRDRLIYSMISAKARAQLAARDIISSYITLK